VQSSTKKLNSKAELRTRYASTASSVALTTLLLEYARYLRMCVLVIAFAIAISLPVLLLPLAPASAGVGANGVYYGVYCGNFAPGGSTGPRGRRGCSPAAAAENGGLLYGPLTK